MRQLMHTSSEAILRPYRNRIISALGVVALVAFGPFAINNFFEGKIALGIITAVVVAVIAVDALAVQLGRHLPVPFAVVFVPIAVSLPLSVKARGLMGVLWCYPVVLLFFFILSRRVANILSVAVVILVVPLVVSYGGGVQASLRFGVTMLLVIACSNIFLAITGELHQRLAEQAIRDPLTGVFNRRYMDDVLRSAEPLRTPAALMLIDIDYFKKINDQFGHAAGDSVIRDLAAAAQERSSECMVFRIGGEEFAVLCQGKSGIEVVAAAERLCREFGSVRRNPVGRVSISIGVASQVSGESPDGWLKRADLALYEAKNSGRNRVCYAAG